MQVETVRYQINWAKFHKGYSFFVPCINHRAAEEELKRVARRLRINILTKLIVQDGIKGLRVWRV